MSVLAKRINIVNFSSELVLLLLHVYAYAVWFGFNYSFFFVIISSFFAFFVIFKTIKFRVKDVSLLFLFVFSLSLFIQWSSFYGLYSFFQIMFTFQLILFFTAYFKINRIIMIFYYSFFNLLFLFCLWFFNGGFYKVWLLPNLNPNVSSFFVFINMIFVFSFICSAFSSRRKNIPLLFVFFFIFIVSIFLIYVTTARSIWLSLGLSFVIYFLFSNHLYKTFFFNILSVSFLCILMFVPHVYIYLRNSILSNTLNAISISYTNKSFFTGRDVIWKKILSSMKDNFLFGHGIGATDHDIGLSLSSHNLYINLYYQLGIVGCFLFLLSFSVVINISLSNFKYNRFRFIKVKGTAMVGAFLISLLIQQSFELFLFQNNLPTSFLYWCGLILFYSQAYKKFDNETNIARHG